MVITGELIMKKTTFLFLLLFASILSFAQNQVATLQHGDSISGVFFGSNAYSSAYQASVDGDIITLSSGTFSSVNLGKAITIRGAGCVFDSLTNVLPTIIFGNFYLSANNITCEGLWFTGQISISSTSYTNNNTFIKCNINMIDNNSYYYTQNYCQFNNCIINQYALYNHHGTSFINSVVRFTEHHHVDIYNLNNIYNSVIIFDSLLSINNLAAYNSIIVTASGHNVSNCSFFNCIGIKTGETSLFEGQIAQNVMEVNDYSDVFETFDGNISYDNIYQLNNSIASSFLGNDGTEVGIYGGMIPYKPRPSYMILKSCNVASQTNENKKLSVEMELLGPED